MGETERTTTKCRHDQQDKAEIMGLYEKKFLSGLIFPPSCCPDIKWIHSEMKVKGFRTGKRGNSKI